jgi:hypothetical protein
MKHAMFCLVAAFVGCTKATPPARPARVALGAVDAATDAGVSPLPEGLRPSPILVDEEGGAQRVLVGPLRVEARGEAVTSAGEATTRPIVVAVRAARGWLFATDRGEVYRSDTFTGRLSPVRAFGCARPLPPRPPLAGTGLFDRVPRISLRATRRSDVRGSDMGAEIDDAERESYRREAPAPREEMVGMGPPAAFVSHGRAAFVAPDGRTLLWSDGDALHALDVPDAVALAWTSATRGAVIVGYRALKTTRDGGRTWRDVTLGAALPLGLAGRADGLYVDTSEGARRIGDDDALTPAATTRAPRGPLIASFEALYERSYARATEPTHACEPERAAEPENRWTPPRFVAALPQRRVGGLTQPAAPRGAASPLGTVRSRAFAHASTVPAVVSVTRPDDPVAGHPVALAWRGEDERGPFTVRVATTAPAAVSVHARWNVVAATRVGLLFLVEERRPGEDFARTAAERSLYWFGATGAQRVGVEMRAGEQLSALALDDGGAMVFARSAGSWRDFAQEPSLVRAIALGPDGAVRAQRAVVGAGVLREVLGLGEVAGRWGLVAAERAAPSAAQRHPRRQRRALRRHPWPAVGWARVRRCAHRHLRARRARNRVFATRVGCATPRRRGERRRFHLRRPVGCVSAHGARRQARGRLRRRAHRGHLSDAAQRRPRLLRRPLKRAST